MQKVLVTGAAGFIGSSIVEALASDPNNHVIAVDSYDPYYDRTLKQANVAEFSELGVDFIEADLMDCDIDHLLDGVEIVFHQAGQPGVRASWGTMFETYLRNNVLVSQRLLESASRCSNLRRFVYASSSSVYGDAATYPTSESTLPQPKSPYGVTKLAAEHLMGLYASNHGVPTVSLRYFTVYGPRQRPDMAFTRFLGAALDHGSLELFGTGEQVRDFTYIEDIVDANLRAAFSEVTPGQVINLSGGSSVSVNEVIEVIAEVTERRIKVVRQGRVPGDVQRTGGDSSIAKAVLGWVPRVGLREGLSAQFDWLRATRSSV